ncbi:MAG TPA: MoxR family ATPase [Dongiaceae bacterium]|jgi:MoxR-like ATPase|nr:MoxR family ATPase [Dongiaceae bacterium]
MAKSSAGKSGSLDSSGAVAALLEKAGYLADEGLATAVQLAAALGKPLLLEGEPGVGKTEIARALSAAFDRTLIRLQCYEGIDAAQALYEWNYAKQLLAVRAGTESGVDDVFNERFLVERPLLKALRAGDTAVLLVDEIDRADAEFEAFLLEFLGDFQITVPELGTVKAERPPFVVLTSNRTRELHDALKRRCLYHWIDFPDAARERRILELKVPGLSEAAARSLVEAVNGVRRLALLKKPGIAETIEWARAGSVLVEGGADWPTALRRALGLLVKDQDDLETVLGEGEHLLRAVNG